MVAGFLVAAVNRTWKNRDPSFRMSVGKDVGFRVLGFRVLGFSVLRFRVFGV